MRKIYLLSLLLIIACKEPIQNVIPKPVVVEPIKEKILKTDNFIGLFKGNPESTDTQFFKKANTVFASVSQLEKYDLQIKLQINCPNSSEIILKATAQNDSSMTFSQQPFNQLMVSGEGKLTNGGIQFKLLSNNTILLDYNAQRVEKIDFSEALRIESISQSIGLEKDSLIIKGKGFSEILAQNIVQFDNQKAEIIEAKSDYLKVIVPNHKDKFVKINVSVNDCQSLTYEKPFEYLTDKWEPLNADLPGAGRWYATTFTIGDKAYICNGMDENRRRLYDLWEFDTKTLKWTEKNAFPGTARNASVAFVIDGIAYVGSGYDPNIGSTRDFYRYNPVEDKWSAISDLPGAVREHSIAFALNGKGYVMTGKNTTGWLKDNWEYDPKTDKWTRKSDMPGPERTFVANALIYENKAFIGGGHSKEGDDWRSDWYEYNPKIDTWTMKAPFYAKDPTGFYMGGRFYLLYEDARKLAVYDPQSDKWIKLGKPMDKFTLHGATFSFPNRAFFGTGFNGQYKKSFWEYKP